MTTDEATALESTRTDLLLLLEAARERIANAVTADELSTLRTKLRHALDDVGADGVFSIDRDRLASGDMLA